MRLFLSACFAALVSVAVAAPVERVRVELPPGVEYLGVTENGPQLEIRLSVAALEKQVRVDAPATVGLRAGVCVVSVPLTPGETPAVSRRTAAADGPVVVRLEFAGASAAAAPPPAAPSTPPAAPLASAPAAEVAAPRAPAAVGPPPPPIASAPAAAPAGPPPPPTAPVAATPPNPATALTTPTVFDALSKALGLPGPVSFDPHALADYPMPASPAAVAIGSTANIVRPSTPRAVVTSLLSDFDESGKLQSGFSFAFTPYTLLRKMPLSAVEYQTDGMKRFLANTQVSLAGRADPSVVTAGQTAARFGVGVSFVFFDQGDLRLDNDLLADLTRTLAGSFSPDDANAPLTQIAPTPQGKLQQAAALWEKKRKANWNAASAGAGVAPAFLSLTGALDEARGDGVMVWTNVALPGPGSLEESMQFIFGGNARLGQRQLVGTTWQRGDTIDLGTQLRYGATDTQQFFAEAQYRLRRGAAGDSEKFVYEIGLEQRVAKGVWINLAWTNDEAVKGGKMIRSGLRYGFGDKAVLTPLGSGK